MKGENANISPDIMIELIAITIISKNNKKLGNTNEIIVNEKTNILEKNTMKNTILKEKIVEEKINNIWVLEIPKINLIANISEGTSKEVLEDFIGHFEETRERIWKYSFSSS